MGEEPAPRAESPRSPLRFVGASYWAIAAALALYVAVFTGARENHPKTDAWEHHRALKALVEEGFGASNPTLAVAEPSVRYSPYSAAIAVLARTTGVDPWDALSAAGVANVLLLALGLAALCAAFDEARAATPALVALVLLWGGPPGYAGSTALSDLPWHALNPSTFALALAFGAVASFRRALAARRGSLLRHALAAVLVSLAALSHGMVAAFAAVWLCAVAAFDARPLRALVLAALTLATAVALASLWPLYDFAWALRGGAASGAFANATMARRIAFVFALPALAASLIALPLRARPLVAVALTTGAACWLLGLAGGLVGSATLARLGLHAAQSFQIALGVWGAQSGILRARSWVRRVRRALGSHAELRSRGALAEIAIVALALYVAAPQAVKIASEPWLARGVVAPLVGADPEPLRLRERLARALRGVGGHDVVLADEVTAWSVPSVRGRIVSALHPELFVADQAARERDVEAFFASDPAPRLEILARWQVRWILLDRAHQSQAALARLVDPRAVVYDADGLVLMDAARWREPEASPSASGVSSRAWNSTSSNAG